MTIVYYDGPERFQKPHLHLQALNIILVEEVLTIQKQDVVCIGGAPPGANVSAPASRAWLIPIQVQELQGRFS